jgi:hypothetical protein
MTVIELRDKLNKLMEEIPNTKNDGINYYDEFAIELHSLEAVDIMFDLYEIGRYIVMK